VNQDGSFMERALALARDTEGLASPNPQVGCVIAKPTGDSDDTFLKVVGEGAHRYAERDHAEIVALKQAAAFGHDVHGATAYVTLEPCSHHGRTGPCADALVASGIGRCVVATADPNPLVSGRGITRLRDAGVEVSVGVCEAEARALNLPFAQSIQHQRPLVTLKAAVSIDGYLAPPPGQRTRAEPFWLTGPEAGAEVHRLRHASDAILTGIGTVLADDPLLTDRSGLPRRRPLWRLVLDPQLRTPRSSQLICSAAEQATAGQKNLLLLCAETAPREHERALLAAAGENVEILRVPASPTGRLNLPAVVALLGERQCLSLLLETGSALNSAFLHEDLVDRVVLFFSEMELGQNSVPFATGGPSPFLLQQRLRQTTTISVGTSAMVTGLLHDPWPAIPISCPDHLP